MKRNGQTASVFPCLNCGRDTGCVNRLVCDECREYPVRAENPLQARAARAGAKRSIASGSKPSRRIVRASP